MAISDEERREVANELRKQAAYSSGSLGEWWQRLQETVTGEVDFANPQETYRAIADLIEPCPIDGETSDGYHTFNELYHHRAVLFSVIVATFGERAWKSKLHADGTMYDGMFIVGIETPDGQATYHYDIDPYWNLFRCTELERAPEWDGHTPNQAIERIGKLADIVDPKGETMTSYERDTRIPFRLGTDCYCKFKDRDEYVHIGDLVAVYQGADGDGTLPYFGYLFGVNYDATGSICDVTLRTLDESRDFCVACDGAFYYATEVADD